MVSHYTAKTFGKIALRLITFCSILLLSFNGLTQSPTIASFTPTSGPIDTAVTIKGTNFDATFANNVVFFGATQATVTAGSATILTVTVPSGATHQPITVLSNGLIASSAAPFIPSFIGGVIDATSFATKEDQNTGTAPISVAIGDSDGDGKLDLDLAVANNGGANVSVFRNTSTGASTVSYAAKVDYPKGFFPLSVAIGDSDGDSKYQDYGVRIGIAANLDNLF